MTDDTDERHPMDALTDAQLEGELNRLPYPEVDRDFDDAVLHRYRRGDLDEAEIVQMEKLLLDSPRARAVLAESARTVDPALLQSLESVVTPAGASGTVAPRVGLVAVVVALAASVLALVLRPTDPGFAPRLGISDVAGHVKDTRAADAPAEERTLVDTPQYVPDGQLEIVLRAREGNAGGIPDVTLYRVGPDGRLVAAPGEVRSGNAGLRIEARAGDMLGETPGIRRLHMVLSSSEEERPDMTGKSPEEGRALVCKSCWMTLDIEMLAGE